MLKSIIMILLIVTGCTRIGADKIHRDRYDYGRAISDSLKEQVLLNIVRLRYYDNPVILKISQIITSYELGGTASLGGEVEFGSAEVLTSGFSGSYSQSPTITYSPIVGKEMVERLLKPVPTSAVLFLMQSGWPADHMLGELTNMIGGYRNRNLAQGLEHSGDEQFFRIAKLMLSLQKAGAIGVRVEISEDKSEELLISFINPLEDPAIQQKINEIQTLLKVDQSLSEYHIAFGSESSDSGTIAIQTRSNLQIMLGFAAMIDVPEEHVTSGIVEVAKSYQAEGDGHTVLIHSGPSKPSDAFIAIPYRGYWFWIDDNDIESKRRFAAMMWLFTVSESGETAAVPLITIPTK